MGSWKSSKGQMGHVVAEKRLVLIAVHVTKSFEASMTFVLPPRLSITVN